MRSERRDPAKRICRWVLALGSLLVGIFFSILSFIATYRSQAQLQLISLTDLDAQYICKSNFYVKAIQKGRTQQIVTTWRIFGSKDLVVLIRARVMAEVHLIFSSTLTMTSSFHSVQSLLGLSYTFQFLQSKAQKFSGQTAFYITSIL